VIVYCREHGRAVCVVDLNPIGKFPELRYRDPRWRNRYAPLVGITGRENAFFNLRETTRPTIEAAGCPQCGVRDLSVPDLLAAFEAGRSRVQV
jgi:hypothetical protein